MTANILGALLFMLILGVGDAIVLMVLQRAGVRNVGVEGSGVSIEFRRMMPFIVVLSLFAGAVVGWFAGPIVFEAAGISL